MADRLACPLAPPPGSHRVIIDRYLFMTMARASALVILVLLAQSAFINFVDQLDEVGEGNFTTSDAVFFTLMLWPSHAFEMFPIAVLLGTLGGILFAYTYCKSGSLILAAVEHAIWGCALFTFGLGSYFYGSTVAL